MRAKNSALAKEWSRSFPTECQDRKAADERRDCRVGQSDDCRERLAGERLTPTGVLHNEAYVVHRSRRASEQYDLDIVEDQSDNLQYPAGGSGKTVRDDQSSASH